LEDNKNDILIEDVILSNIIYNEDYSRKVASFLKEDYFRDFNHKTIFNIVGAYIEKYSKRPSLDAVKIELQSLDHINENNYYEVLEYVSKLNQNPNEDLEWLYTQTEEFANTRAVYNAMTASLSILDGSDKSNGKGAIPKLLTDALSVSLEISLGHDYIDDAEQRYDFYHNVEEKVPFDLKYMNIITKGGVSNKTLNILMAGVNVGKSLAMCHMAAANLLKGKNVLYITMEMAEERISERIDMNLLDITSDELVLMSKSQYMKRINSIKGKVAGKLKIKEYPTASAGSADFRNFLNELRIKKSFKPDIIYIDYLNICISSRIKMGSNVNSYTYVKTIAEELRGLATEFELPIFSATQITRSGFCLDEFTMVNIDGKDVKISSVEVGDKILSDNGYNEVIKVFDKVKKKSYQITLEDGNTIICSEDHLFPIEDKSEKSISTGLISGMRLLVK
jgi:replicative DNA helicase